VLVFVGEYKVVISYLPGSFVAGAIVSLLPIVALIGAIIVVRRRRTDKN
jgi:uncharacterized membrane protein YfhO